MRTHPRAASVGLTLVLAAGAALSATAPASAGRDGHHHDDGAKLVGWAALPADTFVPGSERSGYFTGNPAAPYAGQPVQGFSGIHSLRDGTYLAMSDNGFGAKANSQDFRLRVHRIRPDLRGGEVSVLGGFDLSDPDGHVPWTIWRDGGCAAAATLPDGYTCPAPDRTLTGWDFDLESMQVAPDGTYWFGDEFGPFLVHTDARGQVLEAPVAAPGVTSPSHPAPDQAPNLPSSKGFEGMAISPDGRTLYPMLEGATDEDKAAGLASDLRIYTAPIGRDGSASFTGDYRRYRMESPDHALGDFIAVNKHEFLVIERDNLSGAAARFKRIYLADLRDRDRDGYADKKLLVDLMDLANPRRLGGQGDPFTFPYVTIEDVEIIDRHTIAVLNDNNYPGTGGRGADVRDVNEFLAIRLDDKLDVDRRLLRSGPAEPAGVRFSTYNASLNRSAAGQLVSDLSTGENAQARAVAEVIQRAAPDVLLVNEFDYVPGGRAAELFRDNYLAVSQNGAPAADYPYYFVAPSNTGVPSGLDLDNNGSVGGGNDAFGFGDFPGQYGMVVYSKHPIDKQDARTFRKFRWKDMPGARLPDDPTTSAPADWYSRKELASVRLSSKSHWDLPIRVSRRETVHFLVSHPTPPVFDGPEDRNGRRNFDEIGFWADYVRGRHASSYIYDDRGRRGGLKRGASFVVAGDLNSDPRDGDSIPGAVQQLLRLPQVNDARTPSSAGAVEASALQGGANAAHRSPARFDTADFADNAPGNLRVDYVLPSRDLDILDSEVFWPVRANPLFRLTGEFPFPTSDHRLVWVDVEAGERRR